MIADYLKAVLCPLVTIFGLSHGIFNVTSSFPELAALISGLVASSMIGAFYLGLPLSILRAKIRRPRGAAKARTLERLLGITLIFSTSDC